MVQDSPHRYILCVDCQGTDVEVRLNDIPILDPTRGHPLIADIPANLFLVKGKNLLQARFSPPPGLPGLTGSAAIRLTLKRKGKNEPDEALKEVTTLLFEPLETPPPSPIREIEDNGPADGEDAEDLPSPTDKSSPAQNLDADSLEPVPDGSIKIGEPTHAWDPEALTGTAERTIELQLPFGDAPCLKADVLNPDDETFMALYDAHKHLWQLLHSRDTDAVIELFRPKINAIAAAYGYTEAEAIDAIKVVNMMRDDSIKLQPLWNRDLDIEIFGNGHLARIVDEDGDSPIYFRESDGSLDHYITPVFFKSLDKFTICL